MRNATNARNPPQNHAPRPSDSYAHVLHRRVGNDAQLDELRATAREERASGADRILPVLARLLREIGPGKP